MTRRNSYSFLDAGAFIMLALLAGCASIPPMEAYEGPARSKEQVAIIRDGGVHGDALVFISCIDGKHSKGGEIHALPGKHQVKAYFAYPWDSLLGKIFTSTLEFEVQAGHEYVVDGDKIKGTPLMWVEDIGTKQKHLQPATDRGYSLELKHKRRECTEEY
jgi:hypothetical protein